MTNWLMSPRKEIVTFLNKTMQVLKRVILNHIFLNIITFVNEEKKKKVIRHKVVV